MTDSLNRDITAWNVGFAQGAGQSPSSRPLQDPYRRSHRPIRNHPRRALEGRLQEGTLRILKPIPMHCGSRKAWSLCRLVFLTRTSPSFWERPSRAPTLLPSLSTRSCDSNHSCVACYYPYSNDSILLVLGHWDSRSFQLVSLLSDLLGTFRLHITAQ